MEITVRDPKPRMAPAAPFCDRVVHHALCAVIEPVIERGFVFDSYANRKGKGTHRAVARYERFRHRHVLRCDLYRYFPSVDHEILKTDVRRRIRCTRTLALIDAVIDGSNPQEPVHLYYPGDDLFTPFERRWGLPIGKLTPTSPTGHEFCRFSLFSETQVVESSKSGPRNSPRYRL